MKHLSVGILPVHLMINRFIEYDMAILLFFNRTTKMFSLLSAFLFPSVSLPLGRFYSNQCQHKVLWRTTAIFWQMDWKNPMAKSFIGKSSKNQMNWGWWNNEISSFNQILDLIVFCTTFPSGFMVTSIFENSKGPSTWTGCSRWELLRMEDFWANWIKWANAGIRHPKFLLKTCPNVFFPVIGKLRFLPKYV